MILTDFISMMERIAPPELAWEMDNIGLLIGPDKPDVKKVLLALDCTPATAREAIAWGADLLLTHHPVFWGGVKRIAPDDPATAAPYLLIRHGVGLYAAHTNLDSAPGGVNDALAAVLGLSDVALLPPENMGRIGRLKDAIPFGAFAQSAAKALETTVRCTGDRAGLVQTVALVGGAAAESLHDAKAAGADVFLTGEMKHHLALEAQVAGISVIEAGHYETERVVLVPLLERLQREENDVQYKVTLSERAPLGGI